MNRDFAQASDNYKIAIAKNKLDVDYCLYQKALCDGLNKNYATKVEELKKIESRYPGSNYLSAALNEIAETYYNNLKDQENAIVYYNKILKNYPNSSFTPNCNAQLGNIYYERKQDDKAFEYFDKFVKYDSKSESAKDILDIIKKIFTEKGKIDEMEKYFVALGNPLSENQIEKATYLAAYDAFYTQKDCDLAMPKWEAYISKFPNGKYIIEAQFSNAECAYNKGLFEKALPGYLFVIQKPRGLYSEVALTKASYLYYKDKKYQEALPLYLQMQEIAESPVNKSLSKLGAMRCAFYLNQFETALTECTKVLNTEKLTPQQTTEAKYIKAKSLFETARYDDAMLEFKAITKASRNVTGAEAYYHIARIQYTKKDYKEVEKTINKLISYEYSNDDWNNKGMLLLADAYMAKGDDADAQVILETLIDNKPKQEYIDEAKKRLDIIKAKEAEKVEKEKLNQNMDMKVRFNESEKDSSIMQEIKFEAETPAVPSNTTNIQQPK
jgi:TolA-binding protein